MVALFGAAESTAIDGVCQAKETTLQFEEERSRQKKFEKRIGHGMQNSVN